jgi:hypothetical protein
MGPGPSKAGSMDLRRGDGVEKIHAELTPTVVVPSFAAVASLWLRHRGVHRCMRIETTTKGAATLIEHPQAQLGGATQCCVMFDMFINGRHPQTCLRVMSLRLRQVLRAPTEVGVRVT